MSSIADQQQKLERLHLGGKSGQQQQQGDKDKAGAGSCVAYHQFVVGCGATTHGPKLLAACCSHTQFEPGFAVA